MKLNLQLNGVSDLPPWDEGAASRWTQVENMRMGRGYAERVRGDESLNLSLPASVGFIANSFSFSANDWLFAGFDKVERWSGSGTITNDVTPTGWATLTNKGGLTGGNLGQNIIVNSDERSTGYWWKKTSPTSALEALGSSDNSDNPNAATMRAFSGFIFALDTSNELAGSGSPWDKTESTVVWSDRWTGGDSPPSWLPTAGNLAGSTTLTADSPCVDMYVIRDTGIIFTATTIVRVDFIGGQEIFQFSEIFNDGGILGRNCAVEFEGKVYFMSSSGGMMVTDGTSVVPVADNVQNRDFLSNLANDAAGSLVTVNEQLREIYFCPIQNSDPWAREVYVLDVDNGEIGRRSFPDISAGISGIDSQTQDDTIDGGANTTISGGLDIPINYRFQSPQSQSFLWVNPTAATFNIADQNPDSRNARLVKAGIQPDGDFVYTVRRIWLDGEIPPAGVVVTLGARYDDHSPYDTVGTFDYQQTSRWASLMAKGRQFHVEIRANGSDVWSIQRVGLELAETAGKF